MLHALDYYLLTPSPLCFLEHYLQAGGTTLLPLTSSLQHLARVSTLLCQYCNHSNCILLQYLCELALVHSDPFLKYLPSEVAASAVCLSRHSLEQEAWVLQ